MSGRERRQAADAARADAAFGMHLFPDDRQGGPAWLAEQAFARGDTMFAIDLPISYVQGTTQQTYGASSRTLHPQPNDDIGSIERCGWHLEHVSTTFVQQGGVHAGNYQSAYHGTLTGYYVFRRVG